MYSEHNSYYQLYKNIQELDVQNNNIANYGIDYMLECAKKLELRNLNLRANKFVDQVKDIFYINK